jgi:hypothetical protein
VKKIGKVNTTLNIAKVLASPFTNFRVFFTQHITSGSQCCFARYRYYLFLLPLPNLKLLLDYAVVKNAAKVVEIAVTEPNYLLGSYCGAVHM